MNLAAVMADVEQKLKTITGLRTFPYSARKVSPPAATVALPDDLTYDLTYGRGSDQLTLMILVVVGEATARTATTDLAAYADGSGERSVKETVDGRSLKGAADDRPYDEATVTKVVFLVPTIGGTEYLAAEFTVMITGKGR